MADRRSRRSILRTAGATLTGTAVLGTAGAERATARSADEVLSDAPFLEVSNWMYPTMGTSDDNPWATVYGNFKCPYTQEFVLNHLPAMVEEYVETGRLNFRFRSLVYEPDPSDPSHGSSHYYISDSDPDIARSAYGVWEEEPENYWQYFADMFQRQPSGATHADQLEDRMRGAGVRNWGLIGNQIENDRHQYYLERTRRAAAGLGVSFTPTMEFERDITPPHHGTGDLFSFLDARLD